MVTLFPSALRAFLSTAILHLTLSRSLSLLPPTLLFGAPYPVSISTPVLPRCGVSFSGGVGVCALPCTSMIDNRWID